MPSFKLVTIIGCFFITAFSVQAQYTDTVKYSLPKIDPGNLQHNWQAAKVKNRFPEKSLVIPAMMIAYGFTALENDGLKKLNTELQDEVYAESPHKRVSIDNYLQFAPAVSVYALNAMGIKGKHNFRDRSMIYLIGLPI